MLKKYQNNPTFPAKLTKWQLLGLTLLTAVGYALYSLASDGFYQHDEAAHYLNMRRFWHDPSIILGNWAKLGYKLIYAPFSLLGTQFLIAVNSLVAAFSCYLAYKVAEQIDAEAPTIAYLMLFLQPFWLQLSFRNYSEIITACILVAAVLTHYRKAYWVAALLLSYTVIIRQELYPMLALYGVFLLYNKKWIPTLLLAVFPLVQNSWGWAINGDPFYLLNSIVGTSEAIQDQYPRQGFWHYFKMSLTVFGGLSLTFFLAYLAQNLFQKRKWHWFIIIPLLYYFLIQVVFSIQSFKIGPSTGGNLRYLLVVSPLLAILAGLGLERVLELKTLREKRPVLLILASFVIAVLIFLSYEHNNILFTDQKNYLPFVTVLLSIGLMMFNLKRQHLLYATAGVALFSAFLVVKPIPRSDEDRIVANYVEMAKGNNMDNYPILANHTMFYYFWGKPQEDFENGAERITRQSVEAAEPGTIIIWDSHYSYRHQRDTQLPHTWFLERPEEFRQIVAPMLTQGRHFGMLTFQKQ